MNGIGKSHYFLFLPIDGNTPKLEGVRRDYYNEETNLVILKIVTRETKQKSKMHYPFPIDSPVEV